MRKKSPVTNAVYNYILNSTSGKKGYTVGIDDLVDIVAKSEEWNTYDDQPQLGLSDVVYNRLKARVRIIITVNNDSRIKKIKVFKTSPKDRTPLFYID